MRYAWLPLLALIPLLMAKETLLPGIDVQHVAEQAKKATVRVLVINEENQGMGGGSGSIVSPDGLVYTNWHVAGSTKYSLITLDTGEEIKARLLGANIKIDFALLKLIPDEPRIFPTLPLGDSDKLAPGDIVLAIGAPGDVARARGVGGQMREFQLVNTVTAGLIRAIHKPIFVLFSPGNDYGKELSAIVSMTAQINNGNSGVPAINVYGEQVGINSWGLSFVESENFFMPINDAKKSAEDILRYGRVIYPWLGLYVFWGPEDAQRVLVGRGIPTEAPQAQPREVLAQYTLRESEALKRLLEKYKYPVKILGVFPDSPAEKAGLARGDRILAIQGEKYEDAFDLVRRIRRLRVGQQIELLIERQGELYIVPVTVGEQPPAPLGAGGTA